MSSSDLKFFVVILLVGAGGYLAFFHDFNSGWGKKRGGVDFHDRDRPTITFVAPGTPGAKTWEQLQKENAARDKTRWSR